MRQTVEVKLTLTFEADNQIDEGGKTELENNIISALNNWAESSEDGLCPEQMEGYTVDIRTDME